MARDYRYGHKATSIKPRRTQLQADAVGVNNDAAMQPRVQAEQAALQTSAESAPRVQRAKSIFSRQKKKQDALATSTETTEITPIEPSNTASVKNSTDDGLQKIKDRIHQQSLPKHIRRQMAEEEAKAREEAAQAELERLAAAMQLSQQRQKRINIGIWSTIVMLTLAGFAWVFYASFFLSFAHEMGWVSAETRERLDPTVNMRTAAVVQVVESKVAVPVAQTEEVVDPEKIQYTFYGDLSKEEVATGFNQPLTVSQVAPTYVQLISTTKESYALAERQRLAQKGYTAQMVNVKGQAGSFYVLRMGPYTDPIRLNRLRIELETLGIEASLVRAQTP